MKKILMLLALVLLLPVVAMAADAAPDTSVTLESVDATADAPQADTADAQLFATEGAEMMTFNADQGAVTFKSCWYKWRCSGSDCGGYGHGERQQCCGPDGPGGAYFCSGTWESTSICC